ncbi:MAG TPA: efflux RND transporter periplasmic adaptor subunit [Polyangia bacterium]|nr:efflux RND transporter periplasmic adaptor subunit [Polyangia bacterium]
MSRPGRWGLGLGLGAAVVVFLVARAHLHGTNKGLGAEPGGESAHAEGARGSGRPGGGADRPVPVLLARAAKLDVPITLEGLGSVTAYKTVNVRAQVDGRLDKIVFREGQAVKRGEVLAEIDPRPFQILLHQGQAALARDEGQLHGAERDLDRYQAVVTKQLIPQQQVDDQRATVEQLRGATQGDEAQIENARLQLDYARIKSPIDGVTGVRQVDPGNIVHAADATGIVVVTQLDPIAVLFTLPEDDLPRVAAAQAAGPLDVAALPRDGTQALATGKLEVVDNQINTATATIRCKAIFPNPRHVLWPNQFVRARLQLALRKGALVVPAVAVQHGPQGTFVYVVGADEMAQSRPVTVDVLEGDQALVGKGLAPGEMVVIEGQNQLRPGAKTVARAGAHP